MVQATEERSSIILPNVVALAKTYFGCPDLASVPLENAGGKGTAGSHWERTTFGYEAMTGSSMPDNAFSDFTFQLM